MLPVELRMDSVCDCESYGRDFLVSSETTLNLRAQKYVDVKGRGVRNKDKQKERLLRNHWEIAD